MAVNIVRDVDRWVRVRTALISVTEKRSLDVLVNGLISLNDSVQLLSTGGTASHIAELLGPQKAERHLVQVSEYTGQPETQGGLVKTLDFKIYLGLLTETYNPHHQADLARTGARPIDLVAVNLYPFEQTVKSEGVTVEEARAQIDIGGPSMLRAAAKNYLRVAVLTEPHDYGMLIKKMRLNGGRHDLGLRFQLAQKAFEHVARYDRAIADYLTGVPPPLAENAYALREGE